MEITEKEFAVIKEISNHQKSTQRLIAKKIGISLGLTNLIIKRLIRKGCIKIQEAPPRTILYTLTPTKGLSEKTRKSYQFTLRTISIIRVIKDGIQDIISREYQQGARDFHILGNGELANLAEIVLRDSSLEGIRYFKVKDKNNEVRPHCHVLVTKNGNRRKIDILLELSNRGIYY